MSTVLDSARNVRSGEELDAEKLRQWLTGNIPELKGDISIQQFPSGHSNLTYLLKVGEKELVLRRPPFGSKVKTAHDMGREYKVLSHLSQAYPPAPRPLALCDDVSVLGAPFYVMQRIHGVILRKGIPEGVSLPPQKLRTLCESFIDNLLTLHAVDWKAIGLSDLGKPEGYVERQVSGWTRRYKDSQTDDIPVIEEVARWLAQRMPKESGASIIHNDYKYDNIVLDPVDPTRIIGVLDWEMSTVGDPLMDLGTALGYWIQADDSDELRMLPFGPTDLPGSFTRQQLADRYAEKSGKPIADLLFYFCFALFKTAVVLQQIYFRYKQGLTKDERFAPLIFGVQILASRAAAAAEAGHI